MAIVFKTKNLVYLIWFACLLALAIWPRYNHVGWDIAVYRDAILSLKAGHDPYLDGLAAQQEFQRSLAAHPTAWPPYCYLYPPITVPLLRIVGLVPPTLALILYWLLIGAAIATLFWTVNLLQQKHEATFLACITPLALFFPGLLQHDTVLSGNIAFILYGLVFLGIAHGWRSNRWTWCYVAILLASCFKPPLLTLLAVPLFSAPRQWVASMITAVLGLALFVMQLLIAPSLVHHFLQILDAQSRYSREFGSSPAGVLTFVVSAFHLSTSPGLAVFYLLYALCVFAVLLKLHRGFLTGSLSFQQWMPVLLLGAILLNPRIMQYDLFPISIPTAVIAWRCIVGKTVTRWRILIYAAIFAGFNCTFLLLDMWQTGACLALCLTFVWGVWDLWKHLGTTPLSVRSSTSDDPPESGSVSPLTGL